MKQLLHTYVEYNVWANKRIANLIVNINKSLYDKEVKSSFPTLRKTILHIWDAELAWMARLKNEMVKWPPTAQFNNPPIDEFVKTSQQFCEYVKSGNDEFFNTAVSYTDSRGLEHENIRAEMILHCMNHSSYHRGQLITILRELGLSELVSTDLIAYLREVKK